MSTSDRILRPEPRAEPTAPAAIRFGMEWRNWGRSECNRREFVARLTSVDEVAETVNFARNQGGTLVTAAGEVLCINADENAELLPAAALGLGGSVFLSM